MAPVIDSFQSEYGIQVDYVNLRGAETIERVAAEAQSGQYAIDAALLSDTLVMQLKEQGLLAAFDAPEAAHLIEEARDPDKFWVGTVMNVYGILVNTDLVREADLPKTWLDLADPKWAGKLVSDDPRAAGGGNTWFNAISREPSLGRSFLEKLASNKVVFTRQFGENEKAVARGEYAIYFPALSSAPARLTGAPVRWVQPSEGVTWLLITSSVMKNAPHPNAARLWVNHLAKKESQLSLSKTASVPVRRDALDEAPNPLFRQLRLIKQPSAREQIDMLPEVRKLYADVFGQ